MNFLLFFNCFKVWFYDLSIILFIKKFLEVLFNVYWLNKGIYCWIVIIFRYYEIKEDINKNGWEEREERGGVYF